MIEPHRSRSRVFPPHRSLGAEPMSRDRKPASQPSAAGKQSLGRQDLDRHSPCPCRTFPIPYAPSSGSPYPMRIPSSGRDPRDVDDQCIRPPGSGSRTGRGHEGPCASAVACVLMTALACAASGSDAGCAVEADLRDPGGGGLPSGSRESRRPDPDADAVRRRHRRPPRRDQRPAPGDQPCRRRRRRPPPHAPARTASPAVAAGTSTVHRNRPPINSSANSFRNGSGCSRSTIKRRRRSRKRAAPSRARRSRPTRPSRTLRKAAGAVDAGREDPGCVASRRHSGRRRPGGSRRSVPR